MATYKSIAYDQSLSAGGSQVLLQTSSVSDGDSTLIFTGLNSDYKEYRVKHINYKSQTDGEGLHFQCSADGSNFNLTITSTHFSAYHLEDDSATSLAYNGAADQAQGTASQALTRNVGTEANEGTSGFLQLFNPSSTTFTKHFMAQSCANAANDNSYSNFAGGYFNTTSAIISIQFLASDGDMEAGTFKLYGVN
jgi:hypothetical protein